MYLIIPLIVFILGWMQWYIAVPLLGGLIYIGLKKDNSNKHTCWKSFFIENCTIKNFITLCVLFIWIIISGWGNFTLQHSDFIVRNAFLGALTLESWPVQYPDNTYLCYYFISYLPAALCGKIFGLTVANIALVIWLTFGLYLIWIWICKYTRSNSNLIILSLILFGSFSSIRLLFNYFLPIKSDLTFVSIAQQITLTAHHAIPIMLIICMLITKNIRIKHVSLILSMTVLYSPLCSFLMLIVSLVYLIKKNIFKSDNWKGLFSHFNILFTSIAILLVLFMANNSTTSRSSHFLFPYFSFSFLFYFFTSFIVYCIFCISDFKKDLLFYFILIGSFLLPCFSTRSGGAINDFECKNSLVPTFMLLMFVLKSIYLHPKMKIIYIIFLIGSGAIVSCPLGIYASCSPLFLNMQSKMYSCMPDSQLKLIIQSKIYYIGLCHQDSWNNTIYHPEHFWYSNFTGQRKRFLYYIYKFKEQPKFSDIPS